MQTSWNAVAAAEIRAEMARQELSNQKLAALAGLKRGNVALKAKGARSITLDEFCAMSEALSVPPSDMLARAASALADSAREMRDGAGIPDSDV